MRLHSLSVLLSASVLTLALILPAALSAQGSAPAPPSTGGGATPPPSTGPTPGTGTSPGRQQTPQSTFPSPGQGDRLPSMDMVRPIFLSGKVLTNEGGPPSESATIELVCNGIPRPMAYTNSKGNFSFQLGGGNNMVMPDASVSNSGMDPFGGMGGLGGNPATNNNRMGVSERDLVGCELRAALPGFRSESIQLAGRRLLDNPDVGTLLIQRLGKVEGYTTSMTTANAPKNAKKAFEKGLKEPKKSPTPKPRSAKPSPNPLWDAWRTRPYPGGLINGRRPCLLPLALEGRPLPTLPPLMQHDLAANNWDQLEKTTGTLLKLNPYNYPQAWYYNSVALLQLQKFEDAEQSARQALKTDELGQIPKIRHVLGIILAQQNELPEALVHMKGYLEKAPNANDAGQVRNQMMEIERFLGRQAATPASAPPPQE